jgi:NAD-dependent SIR2 family protein deacetylase
MIDEQKDMKIPSSLVPKCPVCGKPMSLNLRSDNTFVQDDGWYEANNRYANFLGKIKNKRVVYLELGVGGNTPVIIKYPFWQAVARNAKATYACINLGEAVAPREILSRSILINGDIGEALRMLKDNM